MHQTILTNIFAELPREPHAIVTDLVDDDGDLTRD
jgi:hypothetical protein